MSHIVAIATEVRDIEAIIAACRRLGLKPPREGRATLYEGEAQGVLVELPDWLYPVVCKLLTGEVLFDNYGGEWGHQRELDKFLQAYAIEKAAQEARKQGYSVFEEVLQDGSVQLRIQGGDA